MVWQGLHILNIDEQNISWLSSFDLEGTTEVVNTGEVYISNVICGVVVLDLAFARCQTSGYVHA